MPVKPSEAEEEYFARQEFERRRRDAEERARKLAAEERTRLKELHWMRCPKCGMELAEVTFRGVRIDRCTSCAGVWLDAGELETLSGAEPEGLLARLAGLFGQ
ncbi:MAG: hypothetical protein DMF49_06680 [Acidobacteria bacterium]|nr:MAG: hypothetical protein DMF49_06680 [Acidobacteriota bacterium]